ncbi:hypothetical protein V5O48_002751 [Marasmius crinis-equi]|uniref:NADH:flavin oxidoreductase/NADH oxidase N-terminal domain-containing protein n=1 Tax=Marasmius crinis-equi TaxID=585013 RepID=A0ABR3FVU8_9AGAR
MKEDIFSEIQLPCGRKVQNRLVKVALYEHLADFWGGPPNYFHCKLYSKWAKYGWGMIITGNVQVSNTHLALGRDMVVPQQLDEESLAPFRRLALSMHDGENTLAIMQLSHAGRQSSNFIGGRFPFVPPYGPSAIPVAAEAPGGLFSLFHKLMFQTPRAMTLTDIEQTISGFVRGAELAILSGFDGIQLHVAHGYLLAQFLSPKANKRTDVYAVGSLTLLRRITTEIRKTASPNFVLGLKLNTTDYSTVESTSAQEDRALGHLLTIASWGTIDFVELSGGDYENPDFLSSGHKSSRQAFFASFSSKAVQAISTIQTPTPPLILLTGGLRSPGHLQAALSSRHTHLLGVGRASILCPDLPRVLNARLTTDDDDRLFSPFQPDPDTDLKFVHQRPWSWVWPLVPKLKLIGGGVQMAWYSIVMRHMAGLGEREEFRVDYSVGGLEAVIRMWLWSSVEPSSSWWRQRIFLLFIGFLGVLGHYLFYASWP